MIAAFRPKYCFHGKKGSVGTSHMLLALHRRKFGFLKRNLDFWNVKSSLKFTQKNSKNEVEIFQFKVWLLIMLYQLIIIPDRHLYLNIEVYRQI